MVQQMNNKAGLIGTNAAIHNLTVLKTSKKLLRRLGPVVLVSLVGMPFIISEEKLGEVWQKVSIFVTVLLQCTYKQINQLLREYTRCNQSCTWVRVR